MRRPVLLLSALATFATLPAVTAVAPAAALPADLDCPAAVPLDEVTPGQIGDGLTTSGPGGPERFTVEVLGVLGDGIAPGVDMVVIEADSPAIRAAGIWAGMSGSPVYLGDRLLGAIAYGFSQSPSAIAGVTPAAAMYAVRDRQGGIAPADEVRLPAAIRARAADGAASAPARLEPLPMPVTLAGLRGPRLASLSAALERKGFHAVAAPGGSGSATLDPDAAAALQPGADVSAALALGDAGLTGLGTLTALCPGGAVAFGHPVLHEGETSMALTASRSITVVPDIAFPSFELSNVGPVVGTIDQDRTAGVRARLGVAPALVPITSSLTNLATGEAREGRTDVALESLLPDAVAAHLFANLDPVLLDEPFADGVVRLDWAVTGTQSGGRPFTLRRSNRYASRDDVSSEAVYEVATAVAALQSIEGVRVTGVDLDGTVTETFRRYTIRPGRIKVESPGFPVTRLGGPVSAEPGRRIRVRVPLRSFGESPTEAAVRIRVPRSASGLATLTVEGGNVGYDEEPFFCLEDPEFCEILGIDTGVGSVAELAAILAATPRNDQLTVSLRIGRRVVARRSVVLDAVVRGQAAGPLLVLG